MNKEVIRPFSRRTYSATIIVDKENGVHIVGGTPVPTPAPTPASTPASTPSASPAGCRSRANSYDLECYKALAKEYEKSGGVYFTE